MLNVTAKPTTATIRRYRETDLAAVYDICVRTADAGRDARGKYQSDDLMGDLFAGPYVFLEPEVAFVLDEDRNAPRSLRVRLILRMSVLPEG